LNRLAHLVYDKGLRIKIEEQAKSKYESRIKHLVNFNNELMKELEQYDDSLSPEEHHWKRDML
jgi:hypothetical protein